MVDGLNTHYRLTATTMFLSTWRPALGPSCSTEFVYEFDNGATSKIDDVLTDHGGLLHVLPLAVHLKFFGGQENETFPQGFSVCPSP